MKWINECADWCKAPAASLTELDCNDIKMFLSLICIVTFKNMRYWRIYSRILEKVYTRSGKECPCPDAVEALWEDGVIEDRVSPAAQADGEVFNSHYSSASAHTEFKAMTSYRLFRCVIFSFIKCLNDAFIASTSRSHPLWQVIPFKSVTPESALCYSTWPGNIWPNLIIFWVSGSV